MIQIQKSVTTCYGQLVIGPPGSGKSTFCQGMKDFLERCWGRKTVIVNLDPANESPPYTSDIDVLELVQTDDIMEKCNLGPNGALVYAFDFLEQNFEWLQSKIVHHIDQQMNSDHEKIPPYFLFDCPGQIELYTHNRAVSNIVQMLTKSKRCVENNETPTELPPLGMRLCAVNLVDAHHTSDGPTFISACLVSLQMMLHINLPHVNILSKVDLIEKMGRTDFNIDFYTEVLDLSFLLPSNREVKTIDALKIGGGGKEQRLKKDLKFVKLNKAMSELISDYSLVSYTPLDISNKDMLLCVKNVVDKANGYCFSSMEEERQLGVYASTAYGDPNFEYTKIGKIHEAMNHDDNNDLEKMGKAGFQI